MGKKFISWRRVSTFKQNRSGLGLEAQKEIIRYFVEREGGDLIADYSECYTGTELSGCVELRKAMAHAKKEGAILIIGKTDRFRNTIEALQVYEEMGDGNIMFCDLPHTDKFTLTLFFALAEREALITSIRTKQALAAKKVRGEKMGAATEKYKATMRAKGEDVLTAMAQRRGDTKRRRFLGRKETQAFLKILANVFPLACAGGVTDVDYWDWQNINTKGESKGKILKLMRDYRDIDATLFKSWNFQDNEKTLQVKLATYIGTVRRSILSKSEE